jgi:hypothetical protein
MSSLVYLKEPQPAMLVLKFIAATGGNMNPGHRFLKIPSNHGEALGRHWWSVLKASSRPTMVNVVGSLTHWGVILLSWEVVKASIAKALL